MVLFQPLMEYLISILQLKSFEVLQLPQIPKFDAGVVSGSGQVVTVLREGECGDLARVAGEVGHVRFL